MSKKIKELSVRLHGREIGILKLVGGKMQFSYNEETDFPISLSMPLQVKSYKEKICRTFFGGFLPENIEIRKILAQKYKINYTNDFALLKELGRDCAGAISFCFPNEEEIEEQHVFIKGEILSEKEFKKHIEQLPNVPFIGKRMSLAGAQQKTAICLINDKIALPMDNVPTTHIVKPMIKDVAQSIENEYICMKSAFDIGLNVANVEIRKVEDINVLLVERFDRKKSENGEYIKRIPQEDFAQALGADDKYRVTFKDCLKVLNQTTNPALNKREFVKQIIFNYLIGNNDAHAKNFSIFRIFDDIKLTPAYDLLCTSVYDFDTNFAMKIGNAKNYSDVVDKDWEILAQDIDVSYKIVENELKRQKELLPQIVEKYAKELNCKVGYKILEIVKQNCET